MTNYVETRQNQATCEEDYESVPSSVCKTNNDCNMGIVDNTWNGILKAHKLTQNFNFYV